MISMGDEAKEKWVRVMRRNYPPLFAFLVGSAISRIFGKIIARYKNGVYYWYITVKEKEKHGKNICKKWIDNNYIKSRYDNDISLFNRELADTQKLMNEFSALKKNGKLSNNYLIDIVRRVMASYNRIFETIYGPYYYAEPALESMIISTKGWPEDTATDTNAIRHLACKSMVGNLCIGGIIPKFFEPQEDLLELAIKFRTTLSRRIRNIMKGIASKHISTITEKYPPFRISKDIEKGLGGELAIFLQSLPEVKEYVDRYAWISCGWHTGKPLTEKEVAHRCVEYMLGTPQPEIILEQKKSVYMVLEEKRKAQLFELQRIGDAKGINFEESARMYADILMYDGLIRGARRVTVTQIDFLAYELMRDIASCIGILREDNLYFLSQCEIIESLKAKKNIIDDSIIEERSRENFILFTNGKIEKVVSSPNEVRKECCERKLSYRESAEEIRGRVYTEWNYNEPVKGKPLLIEKAIDVFRITKDSIVISEMIEPQQAIFLEDTRGIITEDGHPSCHAVHVSVGKAIPLIVGAEGVIDLAIRAEEMEKEIIMYPDGRIKEVFS